MVSNTIQMVGVAAPMAVVYVPISLLIVDGIAVGIGVGVTDVIVGKCIDDDRRRVGAVPIISGRVNHPSVTQPDIDASIRETRAREAGGDPRTAASRPVVPRVAFNMVSTSLIFSY
jgi:hypothetical protein